MRKTDRLRDATLFISGATAIAAVISFMDGTYGWTIIMTLFTIGGLWLCTTE